MNICVAVSHSVVSDTSATPWTIAHQAPLSMGFSRQEYWSGLPCPPPGDLPHPGIEPRSPALQADSLTAEPPGKPSKHSKDETKIEVGNPALTISLTGLPEPNEAGMGEGQVLTSTNCCTNLKCSFFF